MKRQKELSQLSEWRPFYGAFKTFVDSKDGFFPVAPGRKLKFYGPNAQRGAWLYRPEVLRVFGGLKNPKHIAALISDESLDEVLENIHKGIGQLVFRSHAGEKKERERAMELFFILVRTTINNLEQLADFHFAELKSIAERYPEWPVMLSLNPQDISYRLSRLERLKVGRKAVTPTAKGQRVNFRNPWTLLAKRALDVCALNIHLVRKLRGFTRGAKRERRHFKFFGTPVYGTFYTLENQDMIGIADWQETCASLAFPITASNFDRWWRAISGCVLGCWHANPGEYKKALSKLEKAHGDETIKRNLAMTYLRQAFRSLVGLRSQRR